MSISQSRIVGKKELWKLKQLRKSSANWRRDLEGLHIKQAIQGLFTAGTSPERKRSVANGD